MTFTPFKLAGFAVCGLFANAEIPRPLELNEGVVADLVIGPRPELVVVLLVVEEDAANFACLCTNESRCVLGELSPEAGTEVLLFEGAPVELHVVLLDTFLDIVVVAAGVLPIETGGTTLSIEVVDPRDKLVDDSIPPAELEVEELMLLFID